jgi:hypothetical protein
MTSKTLCYYLRGAVIAVAACALLGCGVILPNMGSNFVQANPEFAHWYTPWLLFLWAAALPCFAIFVYIWKASTAVKEEKVFTMYTARLVKMGAILLFTSAGILLCGNILFLFLEMNHPSIILLSLFLVILALALAVCAAALSRYLTKAAILQEEADGTI